jgi:hypothetical protein
MSSSDSLEFVELALLSVALVGVAISAWLLVESINEADFATAWMAAGLFLMNCLLATWFFWEML